MSYAIAALMILNIVLIFILAVYIDKVKKLRKRFERFMNPNSKNHNIESMLLENIELIKEIRSTNERLKFEQDYLNNRLKTCINYMGVVRYNTFEDVGGDLSYAIALMDEDKNGVVLNSLYYREGCYTYAKPLVAGESKYQLSIEEQQAIDKALESNIKQDKKAERKKIIFKNRKNKKQTAAMGDAMIVNNSKRSNEVAGA